MTSTLPRVSSLSQERFIEDFLAANRPVVITAEALKWPAHSKWSPEFMDRQFGDRDVVVYNTLFSMTDMTTLSDYLARNFNNPDQETSEYVRWYSRLSDLDIPWGDEVFAALAADWDHPSFLPTSGYLLPFCDDCAQVSVTTDLFPYRGLFISGRGARTRLHRDPLGSEAVLWQIYGEKNVRFFSPEYDSYLRDGSHFVDPRSPDLDRFPNFSKAIPAYEDTLKPGEIMFIPSGWFHDVTSLTDSISITWNFVSKHRPEAFLNCLEDGTDGREIGTVNFFLARVIGENSTPSEMAAALRPMI